MVSQFKTSEKLCCPVCRRDRFGSWGTKNGFRLYSCRHCHHIFADIRRFVFDLNQSADVRRYMTHGALDTDLAYYERLCAGEAVFAHTNVTGGLILEDLRLRGLSEQKTWLDIGSGSGYLLSCLKEVGIDGIGVEPGGWARISAEKKKIKVIQGLLTPTTFNEKFAYISATDVLEHQSDPYILMDLIKHYLAKDGTAYLSFPFASSVPARLLRTRWAMVEPPTHCSFFTSSSFRFLLGNLGFRIEKSVRYSSSGIRGFLRLGISLGTANAIRDAFGFGDQMLFIIKGNVH